MSTLVLIVARVGTVNFPEEEDSARRLFGDLIKKTEARKILALRVDSSNVLPLGIAELADGLGIECECLQVDRLDPSTWTGNVNPHEIWSDHLETMIRNSTVSSDDSDLSFMMNAGSNWNAAQIYALYEVLGGSLWITEGEQCTAIRLDRGVPDEGSTGEAVLAGLASFGIDNHRSSATASQLQGLIEGIPAGKGLENSLRNCKEYLEDELPKDPKQYVLNSRGRYNALLTLARKWKPLAVKGGPQGLVIFVRSVKASELVIKYLKEHRAAFGFDRFAFVVGGINVTNQKEVSIRVHEKARDLLGTAKVVSLPSEVCFNIPADGGVLDPSADVMEILQRIRQSNDGIEWSFDVTGTVGLLRPATYQYAHLAGIPSFFIARQDGGGGVFPSGLAGTKHFLRFPDKSQIEAIRGVLKDTNLARFVATAYRFHWNNPNSNMGIVKDYGDKRPYNFNRESFPTGHPMRMDDIEMENSQLQAMKRHLKKAEDGGLVYRVGSDILLTPEGIVAGALLKG